MTIKVRPPSEAFEHQRFVLYLEQGAKQKRWVFSHIASESSSKSQRIKNARNGLKKGLRGRFGMYIPPLLEHLGLAEVEHNARNNNMRAI